MGESWRWQLRDSEGQWIKMGSKVKWLHRGRTMRGTVVGSPGPNVATIAPAAGGPTKDVDTRRITVDSPTHAERTATVTVPPEIHAGEREVVKPMTLKVGDWVDLPAEDAVVPLDPKMTKVHNEALVGQVTDLERRGQGYLITVTGENGKRKIAATGMFPPIKRITPVRPESDAGIGRPIRVGKAVAVKATTKKNAALLSPPMAAAIKALLALAPPPDSPAVSDADLAEKVYGDRSRVADIRRFLANPMVVKNFVEARTKFDSDTMTYRPRPQAVEAGNAGLLDVRRISVEAPALPPQPKSDAGVGRPTRVPKPKGVPAAAKTPSPEEQRRQWWLQRTGTPGPTGTPEQIEALSPMDESLPLKEELRTGENKRRDLLKIAADAKPGTHVWRGETLSGTSQAAASTGIHWSVNPSQVVTKSSSVISPGQTDVIWHGVIEEDTQGVPRSHPMWRGIHRSMDSEVEVRLRPGTHIRILGVRENGEYHKVDRRLVVENKGDLQYEDVPGFAVDAPAPATTQYPPLTEILKRSAEVQKAAALLRDQGAKKRPTAVVFDMDGTLADVSSIRHHVEGEKRDFHKFHTESVNVPPHAHVVELAKQAEAEGHHVAIVTARKAKYRNPTAMWLALHDVPSHSMHMRADNDSRPDYEVKQDIHAKLASEFDIVHAVDDNPNVIKLWQEHGIPTTVVPGWKDTQPVAPQPHGTMGVEEVVKVKDAQPEAKSPKVQAAEKKALAVKTDTRLAEIYEARLTLKHEQFRLEDSIHRLSGSNDTKPKFSSGPAQWDRSMDEALTDFQGQPYYRERWEKQVAQHAANKTKIEALDKEAGELNQVYLDAGTWTRAFLVTNAGGHVHRSMSCSTCYPTTRFHWLPEYSGSDESQIVDDAGERACTVCYPSAPVDTLKRATKILSEDEKTAAVARQERAAAKIARDAAKAAKAISNADGTDLWVMDAYDIDRSKQPRTRYSPRKFGEHLKTETAARQWYIRHESDLMITKAYPIYRYGSAYNPEAQEQILLALAAKHSVTVEEIRAELAIKAKARANKELREMGQPKIA